MTAIKSKEVQLVSRPAGLPTQDNFVLAETEIAPPSEGQVLVRNLFISVDPYMRGRMKDQKSYIPPFELGKALTGAAVGKVVESRSEAFKQGDAVVSNYGWREYFTAQAKELLPVSQEIQPLSIYLGTLGMTGLTAWAGLRLVEVKAGDVHVFGRFRGVEKIQDAGDAVHGAVQAGCDIILPESTEALVPEGVDHGWKVVVYGLAVKCGFTIPPRMRLG